MADRAQMNTISRQGFTLIEMAIVLVIVGLLVGIGTSMVGVLTSAINVRQTKDSMDAVVQSVTSWASANNSIPNTAGFTTVAKTPTDAWGRNFIYLYDNNLYSATPTKDNICGRRANTISVSTTDPAATINNMVFVVLSNSGSSNNTFQSTLTGTGNLNGGALGTITTASSGYLTGTVTVNAKDTDIVKWVTLDELRSKVGCQGAPLKIVNNELPFGSVLNNYTVTLTADGGVPFTPTTSPYQWCVYSPGMTTAALPTGFSISGGVVDNPTTTACNGLPGSSWASASTGLTLSFSSATPPATGSYTFTVVARDNADPVAANSNLACNNASSNDNCVQKVFVLTVNPN
jgi:prepilin-type N-terminal cleavage/methylation domain-containing protein